MNNLIAMTRATNYSEIQPVEPEWLIPGWVQIGGVTYVAGDGGVGKSFLTADWASRVTRGVPLPGVPDSATVPPGSVMLVSAEDDPNMSMAYRLRAAGADLTRVYDVTDDFTLPDGLSGLRDDAAEIGDVRLIVIDPLAAVSSIPITSGNVRIRHKLSMPLERFARSTGIAVVVIHHTVKSGRTAGSKAITDAARQVLKITRSAQDERIRVMQVDKSNVASDSSAAIAYTLAGSGTDTRVEYLAMPEMQDETPREPSTEEKILKVLGHAIGAHVKLADIECPDCRPAPGRDKARVPEMAPVQTQEIAKRAGVDYTACRVALTRAKHRGLVNSPRRGFWALGASESVSETPALELVKP